MFLGVSSPKGSSYFVPMVLSPKGSSLSFDHTLEGWALLLLLSLGFCPPREALLLSPGFRPPREALLCRLGFCPSREAGAASMMPRLPAGVFPWSCFPQGFLFLGFLCPKGSWGGVDDAALASGYWTAMKKQCWVIRQSPPMIRYNQ